MSALQGKRILIFQQRQWGLSVGHPLARRLQDMGAILCAYCIKNSTLRFVQQQTQVRYEHIVFADAALEDPLGNMAGERISLREVCEGLGVDTIWPLVQSVRGFVKSYPDKFGFGFKQNVPDEGIVLGVQSLFKAVRDIFRDFRPDLVVAPNFVSLVHILFELYGKTRGVPMLALTDAKMGRILVATRSHRDDEGPLFERHAQLAAGAVSSNAQAARDYLLSLRGKLAGASRLPDPVLPWSPGDLVHVAKGLVASSLRLARGGRRSQPVPSDAPTPRHVLRDYLAPRRNLRDAMRFPYADFGGVGQFAYYPLQVQPEMQLDVIAPRYNNQIETARQVAMSLPDDMTLVVKDHPTMAQEGLRPRSYLEKIARTPNVKLVDFRIPTAQVLRRAAVVIAPACTTFSEAALLGVPCLQLGAMGSTALLPNVSPAANWPELPGQIRELLNRTSAPEDYEQRLERFTAAALDVGTLLDHDHIWYHGTTEDVDAFCDYCITSILRVLDGPEAVSAE